MAISSRHQSAMLYKQRTREKFRASARRRNRHSYRLDPKPIRIGCEAWHEWQDDKTQAALASMEPPHAPPRGLPLENPWWIVALTSDPCFLSPEERVECIALMAFPSADAHAPDWKQIAANAALLFAQKAARHGKKTELHMSPEIGRVVDDGEALARPVLDGRAQIFMPGYSFDGFESWGGFELFDRRRAKRRIGKPTPDSWHEAYGSKAPQLWLSGLINRAWETDAFDEWVSAISAMQEAVLDAGAQACWIAPRFFAQHPDAMDDMRQLELIDSQMLDQTRSKWAISKSTSLAHKSKPKTL